MDSELPFFVYGTLRPDCCPWDGIYDNPKFQIESQQGVLKFAKIFMYNLNGESYPTVRIDEKLYQETDIVQGYIISTLQNQQEFEEILDQIECYPEEYDKIHCQIESANNQRITCKIYLHQFEEQVNKIPLGISDFSQYNNLKNWKLEA